MSRQVTLRYSPYRFHQDHRHNNLHRSLTTSPLFENFELHTAATQKIVELLKVEFSREDYRPYNDYCYRNSKWFKTLVAKFKRLYNINRIALLKYKEGILVTKRIFEESRCAFAMLEIYCSLILFSYHPSYENMSVSDIEELRFPLSLLCRSVIHKLKVSSTKIGYIEASWVRNFFCRDFCSREIKHIFIWTISFYFILQNNIKKY